MSLMKRVERVWFVGVERNGEPIKSRKYANGEEFIEFRTTRERRAVFLLGCGHVRFVGRNRLPAVGQRMKCWGCEGFRPMDEADLAANGWRA
jgi:hypothetical protein